MSSVSLRAASSRTVSGIADDIPLLPLSAACALCLSLSHSHFARFGSMSKGVFLTRDGQFTVNSVSRFHFENLESRS